MSYPFYLSPALARANLQLSRLRRVAMVARRAKYEETKRAFMARDWDEKAAHELAVIHLGGK